MQVRTVALVVLVVASACGSRHAQSDAGDDHGAKDSGDGDDASTKGDAAVADASIDAPIDAPMIDAFPAVLDVHINCHNDCTLIAQPASINVKAGTSFKVNWINTGDTECDVNKIDPNNHVPLIIGLEPGMAILDSVHDWCGTIFTGKFDFEIRICTIPSLIPVNCGAP